MTAHLASTKADNLYERMLLIRILEDELQRLCDAGQAGDLHFNRGQEAISVGVCAALRPTDYVVGHHRTIAHAVAKEVPLEPLIAEILGKASGISGGRAGEMHLNAPNQRFMFSWQLVGTCVPVAAGLAWAVKNYKKTNDIVAVFHGDAAMSNGQWHEGLNIAAIQKVPLLLVCEDNGLAGNVTPEYYLAKSGASWRLTEHYGIGTWNVDGNNVQTVHRVAAAAITEIRAGYGPMLLNCKTTRLGRHKQGQGDLRTKEELERLAERDPLKGWSCPKGLDDVYRRDIKAIIAKVQATTDGVVEDGAYVSA